MKHYFWITGRAGRIEYILISLVAELLSIGFSNTIDRMSHVTPSWPLVIMMWVILAFLVVLAWISFVCLIRRMHDFNCSGWWLFTFVLIGLICAMLRIPVAGPLMLAGGKLFLWFMPGSAGTNRFGPVFHMADSFWKNSTGTLDHKKQTSSASIEKRIDFKL